MQKVNKQIVKKICKTWIFCEKNISQILKRCLGPHTMAVNLYKTAVRSYKSGVLLRSLSSQTTNKGSGNETYEKPKIATVTLDQEVPDLPKAIYVQKPELVAKTKVTTLSNGLRVASEPRFGQFCTVGKC